MPGAYADPLNGAANAAPGTFPLRAFWRWAEPDNGYGVSGDPLALGNGGWDGTVAAGYAGGTNGHAKVINNNKAPFGGPATCPWNRTTNCGPNDEVFSFHTNGANVVFLDGHVVFLNENIDAVVMRRLVTPSERISPNQTTPAPTGGITTYTDY
jgi:prepilin-type processing-associated H-X9-DG protein